MTGKGASDGFSALPTFRARAVYVRDNLHEWINNQNKFYRVLKLWGAEVQEYLRDKLAHPDGNYDHPETTDYVALQADPKIVEGWRDK